MSSKRDSGSNKFFSVQYSETGNGGEAKTTKIPAKKGKSLKESLENVFQTYDFTFDSHAVFLETSKTPLPLASDCFPYGGCTLNIRATEDVEVDKRIMTLMRDGDKKSPDQSKRFSNLLLHYSLNGFEEDEVDGGAPTDEEIFNRDFYLESSWKDVVDGNEEMERHDRVQQEAIWELITTEKTYIADLRVVTEVFKKCFSRLKDDGFLTDVDPFLIFANIDEIHDLNVEFWKLLITVVENSRKSRQPIKPSDLINAFDRFEVLFQPYITFCNHDTSNINLPNYTDAVNEQVKEYFMWCDDHPRCKRIKLQGFLIKPLQRVTKYSLLIRAVEGKTQNEDEKEMLGKMRNRVETFVSKINSAVHMRQEHEKMLAVLARLETYAPVEAVNEEAEKIMNEYSSLDLKGNIPDFPLERKRLIVKEGPMRLVEKQVKKEVQGYLFSDVFVLARPKKNTDKYKVIRQPFRLDKTVIRVLKDAGSFLVIYLNEYNVMSNAFVLQINPKDQAEWLTAFDKAKTDYETTVLEYRLKRLEEEEEDYISNGDKGRKMTRGKAMRNRFSARNSTIRATILNGDTLMPPPTPISPKAEMRARVMSASTPKQLKQTLKGRRPLTPNARRKTSYWKNPSKQSPINSPTKSVFKITINNKDIRKIGTRLEIEQRERSKSF
uniref:DH domain-containing protein n=1 Tax=Clytia hemisphaerica TaxID=252671 RepID=A0A7M5WUH8_9CNID